MLWLYQRVFFGEMKNEENKALEDVNVREILTIVPLIAICFWIGLYPKPFFEMTAKSTGKIVTTLAASAAATAPANVAPAPAAPAASAAAVPAAVVPAAAVTEK